VKRPWNKITVVQAIKKYGNLDVESMSDKDLKQCIEKNKFKFEGSFSRGKAYQILFEELAEHKIIQPTIVYDFPHETCVLAKPKREDPFFAERFEPYIFGWEIGNSYSEENRPEILRQEWEKQEKEHKKGDEESQRMDEDFIKALEVGLPPVSGLVSSRSRTAPGQNHCAAEPHKQPQAIAPGIGRSRRRSGVSVRCGSRRVWPSVWAPSRRATRLAR